MIIYPAIDIKDGKCVRLKQGKASESTTYFDKPLDAALQWKEKGSKTVHVVDLDGAFSGSSCNTDTILQIKSTTNLFTQVGGGIRDIGTIDNYLSSGIDRVILGTAALNNSELVDWAVKKFGEKIAVSIDTLNRKATYNGWTGVSDLNLFDIIKSMTDLGVRVFIYTDISKDGMLSGPDINGITEIMDRFSIKVIASGGVASIDDIKALKSIGVYGAIIGKALYNGNIRLEEAMEVAECY